MIEANDKAYWEARWANNQTGWDIGYASTPIKTYVDGLEDKSINVLIPGCGNAYEGQYMHDQGFTNVHLIDIAQGAIDRIADAAPTFPKDQLILGDFFQHQGQYDLIIEQTFFCALEKDQRDAYAAKMFELLKPGGRLVGVLFDDPLFEEHPPYGGNKHAYLPIFEKHFEIEVFERAYNSIKPRADRELFISLRKPASL